MKYLIVIFAFIFAANASAQGLFNEPAPNADTSLAPKMELQPDEIVIDDPPGRFIEYKVKVLNRGDGPLMIERIKGSCSCSSGKAAQSTIYPMEVGELILWINLDGIDGDNNIIEFKIYTNEKNSPSKLYVTVNNLDKLLEDLKEKRPRDGD
ncbi:MAG: DUF1573 domain-containing protein [Candidatus Kapaibacterium sp.]